MEYNIGQRVVAFDALPGSVFKLINPLNSYQSFNKKKVL